MKSNLLESIIVIDVETTGPDIFTHVPTYIHCAPLLTQSAALDLYIHYEQTELRWGSVAKRYFKAYRTNWENECKPPDLAWADFCHFIENFPSETVILAGHNISFDYYFIKKFAHLTSSQMPKKVSHRLFDSHSLLLYLHLSGVVPKRALNLTGAASYFGFPSKDGERHSAEKDVELTKLVFEKCLKIAEGKL